MEKPTSEQGGKQPPKRYVFIDVPNTKGTALRVLGFTIDWERLFDYLKGDRWHCDEIHYYKGYGRGLKQQKRMQAIERIGYFVTGKFLNKKKANCDVELTVDAMNRAEPGVEFLLLTGDGDFRYLVEDVIEKGVFVSIVSNNGRDEDGNRRYSTRLKELVKQEGRRESPRVRFINLDDWKMKIQRQ